MDEDDLACPVLCKRCTIAPTPRIPQFQKFREKYECLIVKTYDRQEDPEDHRTARVWFDELPPESIDGYKDLKAAFLAYFMQQKKYVKDPVEIHNIKQRDGETIEDFIERFKVKTERMKGAPECMRISGFMHRGDADHSTKAWMNFMIVRSLSPYNGIIGRPGIREIQAVPSTAHKMLKFLVDEGIVIICSTILIPDECATVTTSSKKILRVAEVCHENLKVALHLNFLDQEVAIGGTLSVKGRTELCSHLKENLDIFKKRGQAPERAKDIQAEVQKLVEAGIMREVYYHDWLSNPVMVKKHDGSWRICVDFTDLKKACLQDCYPLPEINWKVESLYGYPFKCFLDAYKGYHQIQMAESDEEKTAFHTNQRVFCYTKMPFGLKNAGATYQRLVDKAFDSQVSRNIEVYVDDLVVKSHTEAEMLKDIDETFQGIKLCPDKTEAVLQLPSPWTIKEVQSLNGKLASLNRFLSKSSAKSLLLFKNLKKCIKKSDFHWTPEAEQAFKQLKQHLSKGHGSDASLFLTASNNEAEYEALIAGLRIAAQMGVRNVHVRVLVEILKKKSIQEEKVATVVEEEGPTWMTPIMEYLKDGFSLLDDRKEASKLRIKAKQYELLEEVLYRRSFLKVRGSGVK
ncbi:reverse transcriptase domain-containing protein [Tanacetum coccineum]